MPSRNMRSRPIFFENPTAIPNAGHFGDNRLTVGKFATSGRLFERTYFGDGNPRLLDDERFTLSHSPNDSASLQVQLANRGALHVSARGRGMVRTPLALLREAEQAGSIRPAIREPCCTTTANFAASESNGLRRGKAGALTGSFATAERCKAANLACMERGNPARHRLPELACGNLSRTNWATI